MDDKEYINNASGAYKKMLEALDANYTHVVSYHLNDDKEIMLGDSSGNGGTGTEVNPSRWFPSRWFLKPGRQN